MRNIYVTVACQSQLCSVAQVVEVIEDCGEIHILTTIILLSLDPNANPNKRQRQPALLGDHPPDYGNPLFKRTTFM